MLYRTTLRHPNAAVDGDHPNHLVATFVGEDNGSQRPRIGLVPVVDRSGSMGSQSKLDIVTRALDHLSTYLCEDDYLGLVSFDDIIDIPLSGVPGNTAGIVAFTQALRQLHPRGSTNLSGGIAAGLEVAATMPTDSLVRLVVLTDGRANHGDITPAGLIALLSDIPTHVSVSFLGVGQDCDHDLLSDLARAGRGGYGFIESAARSADVLGAEIGGLLETEVRNLRVEISARGQYLSVNDALGVDATRTEDGRLVVDLGQLLVGQTRHVVLDVTTHGPGRRHARAVSAADITVTGILDDTAINVTLLPKVSFGGGANLLPEADDDIVAAVELAQVAHAQAQAEKAAQAGDFAGARAVLDGLHLNTGAALGLSRSLADNYANGTTYNASATLRSSARHAFSGTLSGSGEAFDSLASRTIGSYTTSGQRDVAAATSAAAGGAMTRSVTTNAPASPAPAPFAAAGGAPLTARSMRGVRSSGVTSSTNYIIVGSVNAASPTVLPAEDDNDPDDDGLAQTGARR